MSARTFALLAALAAMPAAHPAPVPELAPAPPAPAARWLAARWNARWIAPAGAPATGYGVYHFRRTFALPARPDRFVVHLSADNRYRLWVNGRAVTAGPQRGEPLRWRFDSVDLAPYLWAGDNVLAVQVWNHGRDRAYALNSVRTAFILQGDTPAEEPANTGPAWRVAAVAGYAPLPPDLARLQTFIVVGPGDDLDGRRFPWHWERPGFDDSAWAAPVLLEPGHPHGYGTDAERWLVPRNLPDMLARPERLARVRRAAGVAAGDDFAAGRAPVTVPPDTTASILLDNGVETNAYPALTVSGGAGATIELAYAEALVDRERRKGHRDEVGDRELIGFADRFRPDGGARRVFTPLDFRTYRYLELRVRTGAEPLVLEDLAATATGYPFTANGRFDSDDPDLARLWEVGWRTARLCAFETYMDCPYYERLQYVGDTRIQALVSLYASGDDRLARHALELFDDSRLAEGLTQSRFPSHRPQLINTFSLLWIGMVHDYWMHRDDPAFVAARLDGVAAVLRWFEHRVDPATGILGPLPYWSFVDWPSAWPWDPASDTGGEPPGARTGGSSIVTLQYAMALDQAADLGAALGRPAEAARYREQARLLRENTRRLCWDPARRLLADAPARTHFSQHANALAVLSGTVAGADARALLERTLADPTLVPCTVYFRFYLLRALKAAGLGDAYTAQLGPWKDMLAVGLTTFAERPEPTRSDCHAWSASPVYELLATVCGVEPGSPGFRTVRIAPHLGPLRRAAGVVPHPAGLIRVEFERRGDRLLARIQLPAALTGTLVWSGRSQPLVAGEQTLEF